jgi:imidazole glycerol-phosphate synthase subunit HisH
MIAIIDYGMGNLRSVQKALENVGAHAVITSDRNMIAQAPQVVLPGVGAMQPAMDKLKELDLVDTIKDVIKSRRPFLGICLGLQLLFDESHEGGRVAGLGILKGSVDRFRALKVPHMGWNQLHIKDLKSPMFRRVPSGSDVYFCHSYFVAPKEKNVIAATTDYGADFVSSVCFENVWGVQFHPEKSQKTGLQILKNFAELK